MNVIVPDKGAGPFPVYYLLHGLSDDYSIWCRRTSIERYVASLPLIVVMPETGRGWYTNAVEGPACENHIMHDVINYVERIFPARTGNKKSRVIGGLSMCGYGSMKLALKHPDKFTAVAAHSGAYYPGHRKPEGPFEAEYKRVFGPGLNANEDVFKLALKNRKRLPAIRFDCGTEDRLIDVNRDLHKHFNKHGIKHEYAEFPGMHEWGYWDIHVQEALAFLRKALNIKPQ